MSEARDLLVKSIQQTTDAQSMCRRAMDMCEILVKEVKMLKAENEKLKREREHE